MPLELFSTLNLTGIVVPDYDAAVAGDAEKVGIFAPEWCQCFWDTKVLCCFYDRPQILHRTERRLRPAKIVERNIPHRS